MTEAARRTFKFGICQVLNGPDKALNLKNACQAVRDIVSKGAEVVLLPECFNSPYAVDKFREYAEQVPSVGTSSADIATLADSPSVMALSSVAKECEVPLIGGSIPENSDGKIFNTCLAFDKDGTLSAKHRKVHLFDIDVPGKITFKESLTLSPGESLSIFNTGFCKIGMGICYDIRFPELARLYAMRGCDMLVYPGAFNMTTGPAHWELLTRARALDNQMYVATASLARDPQGSYVAWGHSSVVGPWGDVLGKCGHEVEQLLVDVDLNRINEVRRQVPVWSQLRPDLYKVEDVTK